MWTKLVGVTGSVAIVQSHSPEGRRAVTDTTYQIIAMVIYMIAMLAIGW